MQGKFSKALLCASIALVSTMASARHHQLTHQAITVTAAPGSVSQWTTRISRDLDRHLIYPQAVGAADYPEGAVRVAFRCSETGEPAQVTVIGSSHSNSLDQAAVYAVRHIATLHPLPDSVTHDRPMEAWIVFAASQDRADQIKADLQRRVQLAAAKAQADGRQVASLEPLVIASR